MIHEHEWMEAVRLRLERIEEKVDLLMSAQDDIDAAAAALTLLTTDVAANVAQLATDVAAIKAALAAVPAGVDTTALHAAVDAAASTAGNLDAAVSSVTAETPPPAAPTST